MSSPTLPAPPRVLHALRRPLAWLARLLVALLVVLALLAGGLALFDFNLAKPWISAQLGRVLKRPVQVDGELQLSWALGTDSEPARSRWLPRLRLRAQGVAIGNAAWADSGPWLARGAAVDLRFSPLALLHKHWLITDLQLRRPDITMERGADGRKNWRFSQSESPSWTYEIHHLAFDQLHVRYVDRPVDLDLAADITPVSKAAQAVQEAQAAQAARAEPDIVASLSGRWRQAPLKAQVQGGPLKDLLNDGGRYGLRAEGEVGQVRVQADGNLDNPHRLQDTDLRLALQGDSLADLYPSTGVPLPRTRAFRVEGQLAITRQDQQSRRWDWHYQHFTGRVGDSDFSGDAHYLKGLPRPQLHATVQSDQLRLADLVARDAAPASAGQPHRVLSTHAYQPQRWDAMDADVSVSVRRFALLPKLVWQDLSTRIQLKDRLLTAQPLRFTMAGGSASGSLALDGRQAQIHASLQLEGRQMQLRQLFPRLASLQASLGTLDGQVSLAGRGNSMAQLLGSASGRVDATTGAGTISQFILEAAGLNLADAVFTRLYRDRQVKLYCGVAALRVQDGQAHVERFILNTEDAVVTVSGQADLARETLALDVTPQGKHLRVLSLTTPLYVKGSFAQPEVGAHGAPLAARAAAAAALALVAPVAAVVPLITPGKTLPDDCG